MASHDKLSPVRVDPETYRRLRQEAERAGRTITDEVARRLGASFERDAETAADPKLADLQERIAELADVIQSWGVGADWYSNAFAFETFRAGIAALIDAVGRPEGEVALPPGSLLLKPGDDPAAIGRVLARAVVEKPTAGTGR